MTTQTMGSYPLHLDAELDQPSRWLWLVKWVLIIPHAIVLAFLWIAFMVLTVVAFFSILFTGKYPRSIFEFNVGVMRWSWRVAYYTYSALGTDRYPPFTIHEAPDYPAHLSVDYPEHLSRGLVLVKWWLLALPHLIIVGILAGGTWFLTSNGWRMGGGLIGILVLVAAVMLTVTGTYPQTLYDLILGLNRWVLRVAAYTGLMTDEYPPFRLDIGGSEGASTLTVPPPTAPAAPTAGTAKAGWSAGRITALVIGALLTMMSFAPVGAGIAGLVYDRTQRDAAGYLHTAMHSYTTSGYAVASDSVEFKFDRAALPFVRGILGDARVRVRAEGGTPVFIGVAPTSQAEAYLSDVHRMVVSDIGRLSRNRTVSGGPPSAPPASKTFWTSSKVVTGTQTLAIPLRSGDWTFVAMNANGSAGVRAAVSFGATAPNLGWISLVALVVGVLLLALGVVLMVVPIMRS